MNNKNEINKIKLGYIKVPNKIFEVGLSPGSISLYCYLLSCSEEFNPSIRWVAKNLNVSNNSVIKYYKELENSNIIYCLMKGYKGSVSKWVFNSMDTWK